MKILVDKYFEYWTESDIECGETNSRGSKFINKPYTVKALLQELIENKASVCNTCPPCFEVSEKIETKTGKQVVKNYSYFLGVSSRHFNRLAKIFDKKYFQATKYSVKYNPDKTNYSILWDFMKD